MSKKYLNKEYGRGMEFPIYQNILQITVKTVKKKHINQWNKTVLN